MKTQQTTRHLLNVILCTLALGSPAWAGGGFFDDFSDGSIQDGSPVTWGNDPSDDGVGTLGKCKVTAEGLEFTPDWPANKLDAMWRGIVDAYGRPVHYTGNLTIRTQVKIGEATTAHGSSVTLWFRGRNEHGYLVGINTMVLWFLRADGPNGAYAPLDTWHYPMNGSFDPKKEFILQVDVIDLTDSAGHRTTSRLEARWWAVGQEMPVQPQLTVHDATYEVGEIAIGASCDSEQNRTTIFRWVEVIGTEVEPIVDFNGDGTVGSSDLLRLIESWGQADPVVDLDRNGVVDKKDLEVLMDHWQQDVSDPTLAAHWAFDETAGFMAYDRAGANYGTVMGLPAWQPTGGVVDGALELNGKTFVIANSALNPADGPFSILAWVKGGVPGQGLLAQQSGLNWLRADPTTGAVMTELQGTGRSACALSGDALITDGNWHRLAFTWDGAARGLYVDDVLVAADTQTGLAACTGRVLIGCNSNMAPGTFWSGLIDDVRIYNRAVKP